jgi:chemotaxis methyl-accepting protein methylase
MTGHLPGQITRSIQSESAGGMTVPMKHVTFIPATRFDGECPCRELGRLFVPGNLAEGDLERRIGRLDEYFRLYAGTISFGLWAPGLRVCDEMRLLTASYMPMAEIRSVFRHLARKSLKFTPTTGAYLPELCDNWLDVAAGLPGEIACANPAVLVRRLLADEGARRLFFFAALLPRQYGGEFGRYPLQLSFLRQWVAACGSRCAGAVRVLDAACGTGEGTYDVAKYLMESGIAPSRLTVEGCTLETLELFAAAQGYFPHDPARQNIFRQQIKPHLAFYRDTVRFYRDDLTTETSALTGYDIVICNGLLGGPLLHDHQPLENVIRRLVARLDRGGIFLAADRFHGGWKKRTTREKLESLMASAGLNVVAVPEGVGGVRI